MSLDGQGRCGQGVEGAASGGQQHLLHAVVGHGNGRRGGVAVVAREPDHGGVADQRRHVVDHRVGNGSRATDHHHARGSHLGQRHRGYVRRFADTSPPL